MQQDSIADACVRTSGRAPPDYAKRAQPGSPGYCNTKSQTLPTFGHTPPAGTAGIKRKGESDGAKNFELSKYILAPCLCRHKFVNLNIAMFLEILEFYIYIYDRLTCRLNPCNTWHITHVTWKRHNIMLKVRYTED